VSRPGAARRVARAVAGVVLLAGSYAEAKRGELPPYEERLFRMANHAPDAWAIPVRAVMQAGTFGTVPAIATVAFLAGRRRLAATLLVGGTLAWFGAKAIKPYGGRARPAGVLEDVITRERIEGDLGWVSGHSAVATTTAFILADHDLPGWARPVLVLVVAVTAFGRMYVGAHLPHDTVGGAGLGMVISAAMPSTREPAAD
jgi:membrane-associated phospholipid phosphatase